MQTRVASILEHKGGVVHSVSPEVTVAEAVDAMNRRKVGSVVVLAEGRLAGIFTERDVLVRVVAAGRDPQATLVREVMTARLVTITPTTTAEEAMVLITDRRCRHLPVCDGDRLAGLVSIGDLMRWVVRDQQRTIDDLHDYISTGG